MKKSELKELIREVLNELQGPKTVNSKAENYNKKTWIKLTKDWKSSRGEKLEAGSELISWLNPLGDAVWYTRYTNRAVKEENIPSEYFTILNKPVPPE